MIQICFPRFVKIRETVNNQLALSNSIMFQTPEKRAKKRPSAVSSPWAPKRARASRVLSPCWTPLDALESVERFERIGHVMASKRMSPKARNRKGLVANFKPMDVLDLKTANKKI